MKTLHKIDFPAQMVILIASVLSTLIEPSFILMGYLFGIGGWQVLMALLFAFDDTEHRDNQRQSYERILITCAIIGALSALFPPVLMVYALIMLFVGFVMGIWNMTIAHREYKLANSEHQVWNID